jgi:catechol 2,3-dioxygenase-like lactoylglutathione lyase family enzyme
LLKRFENVGIAVQDIRRAAAFYTEMLGFTGLVQGHEGSVRLGDVSL